jgi:hypothetical protein
MDSTLIARVNWFVLLICIVIYCSLSTWEANIERDGERRFISITSMV